MPHKTLDQRIASATARVSKKGETIKLHNPPLDIEEYVWPLLNRITVGVSGYAYPPDCWAGYTCPKAVDAFLYPTAIQITTPMLYALRQGRALVVDMLWTPQAEPIAPAPKNIYLELRYGARAVGATLGADFQIFDTETVNAGDFTNTILRRARFNLSSTVFALGKYISFKTVRRATNILDTYAGAITILAVIMRAI